MTSSAKTKQNSTSDTKMDPWGPAKPYLKDMIGMLGDAGGIGLSPDQQAGFSALKNNALAGDPWTANKAQQTDFLYDQAGGGGRVATAYDTANTGMTKYANGDYLDPMSNPQMAEMLKLVGDNAFDRVNSAFAGAGRAITGNASGQQAAARGVAQAQLPILFDQFNKQQGMQMNALNQLLPMAQGATDAQAGYGAAAGQQGQTAIDAHNYSAERLIDLDQQIKGIPYEDMALISSILFPAAGMGGTSSTKSQGTAKTSTSLFSDRRLKQNIRAIGETYDGQTIYAYEYTKAPGTTHIGLIAQEVQEDRPDAVTEFGGYLMVDYDIATKGAEA